MIEYNFTSSLLKTYTGFIKPGDWVQLNTNPLQVVPPNKKGYIFPVAFYYMISGAVIGGTQNLFLNTPYQVALLTGCMASSTIAPANVSGTYSMFSYPVDFYYPEVGSFAFDPNMNYLQLWQTIDEVGVSIPNKTPYVCLYYTIEYNTFKPF